MAKKRLLVTTTFDCCGDVASHVHELTADNRTSRSLVIAPDATSQRIPVAIPAGPGLVALVLAADGPLTVSLGRRNDQPIELDAGKPFFWHAGWKFLQLIDSDVTALVVSNTSDRPVALDIDVLTDEILEPAAGAVAAKPTATKK